MFQNCTNCISASKKCNSCWVRLSGSIVWCTIFCCTIVHTSPSLDCTWCAIAIVGARLAINCKGCKITRLQTADLHTIAPDYCNWCATAAAEHHRHCKNFALQSLHHAERCATEYSLEQNVGQGAVKRCIEIAQKCFSIAKMHKQWEILQIYCSCPHQLAWHFRRSCRSLQDCATKCANHLSTCNVGQHIMLIHVLLLSSYTESTLVRLSYPLAAGSNLFKHVSWENLTKSNPTDNKATIQWFFIWNELGSS